MKRWVKALAVAAAVIAVAGGIFASRSGAKPVAPPADDGKLRIIAFGAHPDDCEIKAGGVGALWEARGDHVKLVSVTNGDIGHWRMAGGPLANRRREEARRAGEILGTTSEVLDIHDGEVMPTLENRKAIVRLIREWGADIVLAPDIEAGNILVKALIFLGQARSCGIIAGARVPLVVTSRAESSEAKYYSILLALAMLGQPGTERKEA